MSSFLPHFDPDPAERSSELEKARREYQYNYEYVSPLAFVDKVPRRDNSLLKIRWLTKAVDRTFKILANHAELAVDPATREARLARHQSFAREARRGPPNVRQMVQVIHKEIEETAAERPRSLDDYADLFRAIGLPPINKDFTEDRVFAYMRVGGPNPLLIQRVGDLAELQDRMPITEEIYRTVMPQDSLAAAKAEDRLYLADYQLLDLVEDGDFPVAKKYLYSPLALFVVDEGSRELRPVAIQCEQKPGRRNPIFTPEKSWDWMIAKTIVEVADGNYHEMVSHLGRTHLLIEPFVIATHRQLASRHPVNRLLMPHFEGTLFINDEAQSNLIAAGGTVDKVMAGTIESTRSLAVKGVQTYPFNQGLLPDTLARRGVGDETALPDYPYRDDAMLYWNAIHSWAESYLKLYYPTDADVGRDRELQSWASELMSKRGGRVLGFGQEGGKISTRGYLVDVATMIMFTSSVQHAAVNFPQYDLMSYVPNMPGACYRERPTKVSGASEKDFLDFLPPLNIAQLQTEFLYFLGTLKYTTLGKYGRWHFRDRRVHPLLDRFKKELDDVDDVIKLRNRERWRPYKFLSLSGIPQSINI